MTDELVPYRPHSELEEFQGLFLVPADWKSCGPVIHIAGAMGSIGGQPVALALTDSAISICNHRGPVQSIPIGSIRDARVEDLRGISLPVDTPSGVLDMVPSQAKGISISYLLSPMGTTSQLILYTLTPKAAYEWMHEILTAISRRSDQIDRSSGISRR